jgi:hypothetical protein
MMCCSLLTYAPLIWPVGVSRGKQVFPKFRVKLMLALGATCPVGLYASRVSAALTVFTEVGRMTSGREAESMV